MAEELKKPAGASSAPSPAPKPAPEQNAGTTGDIPSLFENVGQLIDSTVNSVSEMLVSATTVTEQVIDNINVTVQSDAVKQITGGISDVTENVAKGISSTFNPEQIKESIDAFAHVLDAVTGSIAKTMNSEPVRNLFDSISTGIGQMTGSLTAQAGQSCTEHHKAVEIPYSHNRPAEEKKLQSQTKEEAPRQNSSAAAPAVQQDKPATAPAEPEAAKPAEQPYSTIESSSGNERQSQPEQKKQPENRQKKQKSDPSRKGTFPRSKGKRR
ncbi:MAG: hypothetical protein UMU76_04700 [Prosthecochloris sp.]|nr:hypothetical protein [Prosthecochloris sp.]